MIWYQHFLEITAFNTNQVIELCSIAVPDQNQRTPSIWAKFLNALL